MLDLLLARALLGTVPLTEAVTRRGTHRDGPILRLRILPSEKTSEEPSRGEAAGLVSRRHEEGTASGTGRRARSSRL
jgi:hypothetical protein